MADSTKGVTADGAATATLEAEHPTPASGHPGDRRAVGMPRQDNGQGSARPLLRPAKRGVKKA